MTTNDDQDDFEKPLICPFCNHRFEPSDADPWWQCPSCATDLREDDNDDPNQEAEEP